VNKQEKKNLAYIIGVALGDGNLSNPNKRAIRLRITCDSKYPKIGTEITQALKLLFPSNKVSYVHRKEKTCFDISVYSNKLDAYIPWKVGCGTKHEQQAQVPDWVLNDVDFIHPCLKGLIQTDGSIYQDRGYMMINFTNIIKPLAKNVESMIKKLGYTPHLYQSMQKTGNT